MVTETEQNASYWSINWFRYHCRVVCWLIMRVR